MEVEVKITLSTEEDYIKCRALLDGAADQKAQYTQACRFVEEKTQKNTYFDGVHGELSREKAMFRLRHLRESDQYIVTLKAKAVLADGISRAEETEEVIPKELAIALLIAPEKCHTLQDEYTLHVLLKNVLVANHLIKG